MKTLSIKLIVIFSLVCVCVTGVFAQKNDALAEQSLVAIRSQKLDEALQICKKILASEPTHPKANYACGAANHWLKNNADAEKYLVEAEKTIKDKPQLYAFLGVAYYLNRRNVRSLPAFNMSLELFAKAVKLDPKFPLSYEYRANVYFDFYNIGGLSGDEKLKEAYYSNLRQLILLEPKYEGYLYEYAERSYMLNDFGQAIPVYTKFLANPNLDLDYTNKVCKNAEDIADKADSDARFGSKKPYPNLWIDAISLMKSCKNTLSRLETDETRKKERVSFFREKAVYYHWEKANRIESVYLADPAYLAELTEAINAGETKYYGRRADVYTFLKQFAKADADKKSKIIAEESKQINNLIAEEKRLKKEEEDFANKNRDAKGNLSLNDFKTDLAAKKSRLALFDRILALNIPQEDKDAVSARRNQLADVIEKSDAMVANAKSEAESNEREQNRDANNIKNYNEQAREAASLYKKVGDRTNSIDDCRMLVGDYPKKCVIEKLELNIRDLKNTLYYLREARKHAESMTNDETKRNFLKQADQLINTVEESLSINEKSLREVQGK